MTDDVCGADCVDGSPCQNPAGSCPVPSHSDPNAENPHGRDPKLTKDRQERIAQAIEDGASITEAARKNGIHRETFGNWMRRGQEQDEGIYADFFDRLTRARGQGESSYRSALMEIAIQSEDTATLMAMLKQRYPESWGEVDRGEQSGGVVVNVGDPDEHEIDPDTLEVIDEQ